MKIFYIYRTARKPMSDAYKKGKGPSTFLYGLPELRKLGHQVDFSDRAYHRLNISQYLFWPMEKIFMWLINYPLGFKLHQAILLLPKMHRPPGGI